MKSNGLFPTHLHDGIECVTTIKGTGFWWIADKGGTTTKVPTQQTLLVPDLTVHTGGNVDQGEMNYLSTHVMRAGAPFRDICTGSDTRTLQAGEGVLVAAGTTVMVGNAAEGNARLAILEVTAP